MNTEEIKEHNYWVNRKRELVNNILTRNFHAQVAMLRETKTLKHTGCRTLD